MVAIGGSMIHLKFPSVFPLVFEFRKYGMTYHNVGYCCGMNHYMLKFILFLKFALNDKIYWRCPQCGKLHCTVLSWHTVPKFTERESGKKIGCWMILESR